jgi:hypothetical protein
MTIKKNGSFGNPVIFPSVLAGKTAMICGVYFFLFAGHNLIIVKIIMKGE